MPGAKNRLLIVDDEPAICTIIARIAEPLGFSVESLNNSGQFLQTLKDFQPSLLILDLKMPGVDGVQLLHQVKEGQSDAQVIVISGMDQRVLNTAEKLGRSQGLQMLGVLQKPLQRNELEQRLKEALSASRTHSRADLVAALNERQFVVHYQPKIARDDGAWRVDGAEALVRWQHPVHGLLLPGEFLALMEEYRLIERLTDLVLEAAIRQAAAWKNAGMPLKVAVNLSASLIEDLEFPNRLTALLQEHDVPGSLLTIELTESTAMADATKAMDIFLRLCVNDISLSIDDFGTGFSSLQQLYQLPFDELKIDRMFIGGLPNDDEARAIVRATVDMAHALNITVCAEGVETREALEYLESVNCDRAQGYLIGRAVPAGEFERVMRDWNSSSTVRGA
ncbi:MAG TPA: EAL domain-containing response regulator [Woeseiaceae bacterium]|nr:EAL domain-containing response regulator [Woeseiaceae bacterium]